MFKRKKRVCFNVDGKVYTVLLNKGRTEFDKRMIHKVYDMTNKKVNDQKVISEIMYLLNVREENRIRQLQSELCESIPVARDIVNMFNEIKRFSVAS